MKIYGIVYLVRNIVNGKVYVGQTIRNLQIRKKKHLGDTKRGSSLHFHNALRKYGEKNFKWKTIFKCYSRNQINEMEKYFVEKYDSMNNGYNLTSGGERDFEFSDETKKKMSLAQKGKKHSSETKKKMSLTNKGKKNPFFGKHHSEETKKKMSLTKKGKKLSEEHKKKLSKAHKGKKFSEEHKKNISKNHVGMKNKHHSEETKKKMSIAIKKYLQNKKNQNKEKTNETTT